MLVYKIVPSELWRQAVEAGRLDGAPVDLQDGFIHFSTGEQVRETASRHFAGQDDLLLVAIDAERLGAQLLWEPSRGGALFPHFYGPLDPGDAVSVEPLRRGADGSFAFPPGIPA